MKKLSLLLSAAALFGSAHAGTAVFDYGSELTIPEFGGTTPTFPTITPDNLGTITDLNVFIEGYTHASWRDVDFVLLLLTEDGSFFEKAVVLRGEGVLDFETEAVSDLDITYDDEATDVVPVSGLVGGTYQPTDYWGYPDDPAWDPIPIAADLSEFADGLDMGRSFALYVFDYFGREPGGSFDNWGLEITFDEAASEVPVPGVGLALGGALLVSAWRRRGGEGRAA